MDTQSDRFATNPDAKPTPHRPEDAPSMDSRQGHGLGKDEAFKGKK